VSQDYVNSAGQTGRFTDAQFLVFVNRILAFAVALVVIMLRHQPVHKENQKSVLRILSGSVSINQFCPLTALQQL
jgi:hypothetical protein